jgi:hypothetical protein
MLVYDPATNPLNNNEWAFPLTECFHVAAMALSIGTIAIVDLRLLGLGATNRTAGQLVRSMELWTIAGFVIVVVSGLLIFSSDPNKYAHNEAFQLKMGLLVAGILYNYTLHRFAAQSNRSSAIGFLASGLSLLLWAAVVFSGIFIAFI